MQLVSLLDPKTIYYETSASTKEEIYQKLVERICRNYNLPICGKELLNVILERDKESSTIYPSGLAIPHIRMEGFEDTVIGICIPRKQILDNDKTISFIALIITDKASAKLYLNLVAALMKLSKDKNQMDALMAENDGIGFCTKLKSFGIKIKDDLTVGDIMNKSPLYVFSNCLLKDLGDLINEHHFSYIPVVDDNMKLIGEVSILQYLKVGIPDYLMMMESVNFLKSFEPFEHLYEKEDIIKVSDIMSHPHTSLTPATSVIEAAFEMIQLNQRFFPVVENGKLVGIITSMDIFRNVIRA